MPPLIDLNEYPPPLEDSKVTEKNEAELHLNNKTLNFKYIFRIN